MSQLYPRLQLLARCRDGSLACLRIISPGDDPVAIIKAFIDEEDREPDTLRFATATDNAWTIGEPFTVPMFDGCPICVQPNGHRIIKPTPCEQHATCPQRHLFPISLDRYDLKEHGTCKHCAEAEEKRIAVYERRERDYVFGPDDDPND